MKATLVRLLPAGLITLALHGTFFSMHFERPLPEPPKLVERISISLPPPPPPPPPQDIVVKELPPPPPELPPIERQPLRPLPPEPKQFAKKKLPPPPELEPLQRRPLNPLPPMQQTITRQLPPPPPVDIRPIRPQEFRPLPPLPPEPVVQQAAPVHEVSDLREATPLYQHNPKPEYPLAARRRGLQGVVLLEVLIDVNGKVRNLRLAESSGHNSLDQAALQSVRTWLFSPGTVGGKPQEMWVKVPVRFELNR